MFAIPSFLTWSAKALGAREAVTRFFNGSALGALAIATAGVVVIVLAFGAASAIRSGGAAAAVGEWQAKLAASRLAAGLRERQALREADARAAAERAALMEQIRETASHAAALERELARLNDNPVAFPVPIVKELRK